MAVPTISAITPTVGPTMGRTMIDITGTGFRLPPTPPPGPTDGVEPQTVDVLFGTESALRVRVLSETRVLALSPVNDPNTVDIVLRNLDDNGDPIVGEEATLAAAFQYARPKLTAEFDQELARVVRTLLREMRRQIVPEVAIATHTDFDEETGTILRETKLASLPGLVLVGPDLVENRQYSQNEEPEFEDTTSADGDFVTTRVPYTVDLRFEFVGVSDRYGEMLNLMHVVTMFFESNKFLRMLRDVTTPSLGRVAYEMDLEDDGEPKASRTSESNSNLRQFAGSFVIRGFDLEELASYESGDVDGVPKHEIIDRSRTHDDVDVELDPTVQIEVSSGVVTVVDTTGPVVSSIKSEPGAGDC